MATNTIKRQNFSGGITPISEKVGPENSARFIKNLNIFEDPSFATLSRKATKVSGEVVDALPLWGVGGSPWDQNRYYYLQNGKIIKEDENGDMSSLYTVANSEGQGMVVFNNALYYAKNSNIGRYYPLDGTPTFIDNFQNWWIASQLEDTLNGSGETYALTSGVNEGATHRKTFTASHDPIVQVSFTIVDTGTGTWTIEVHNQFDDVVASRSVGQDILAFTPFIFLIPGRITIGSPYHLHVYSSDGTGTVQTGSSNNLETAQVTVRYLALMGIDYNPMIEMLNGFAFGNERYIGFFDGAIYNPNRIILAPGFRVRTLAKHEEFLVAGAYRGRSFQEAEEARLYFWDGISPTFNFFEDIKIGAPNALVSFNGLMGVFGNNGSVYKYIGGEEKFEKVIDKLPKLKRNERARVSPGSIDTYNERMIVGYAEETNSSTLEQGIYEIGSQTSQLRRAFSYPYRISTNTTQGITIGMAKSFGQDLYIGWQDDDVFGIDKIAPDSDAVPSGSFEDRIFDALNTDDEKQAIKLEITFEELQEGETVTPKYKINRTANFTTGTPSEEGAFKTQLFINEPFREIEWGFDVSSEGTFPIITGVNFIYDTLEEEADTA